MPCPFFFLFAFMTLYDYIADKSPSEAWHLLSSADRGLHRPDSREEMSSLLRQYVHQGGEGALMSLARIHPDRQLLEKVIDDDDNFSQASGGGCGCQHNQFQGPMPYQQYYAANAAPPSEGKEDKLITLLIGGSLMLLVTTFALKQL